MQNTFYAVSMFPVLTIGYFIFDTRKTLIAIYSKQENQAHSYLGGKLGNVNIL
jgi:hypothetical protein